MRAHAIPALATVLWLAGALLVASFSRDGAAALDIGQFDGACVLHTETNFIATVSRL